MKHSRTANLAQPLFRQLLHAVTAECLTNTTTLDDFHIPVASFRAFRNTLYFKGMVLARALSNRVVVVRGRPEYVIHIIVGELR